MSNVQKKNHTKLIVILFCMMVIVSTLVIYYGLIDHHKKTVNVGAIKINGILLPQPNVIQNFAFTDHYGNTFTKDNLKGHWSFLFFGFTNCGYVCPTTMTVLNKMYKMLEKNLSSEKLPMVILVSVDPERDTVARMNDYINSFNPRFVGLRADSQLTDAFVKNMHVSAVKMQAEGADDQYTINHSAEILLINPDAKVQAYFSYPHNADQMAKDYKLILGE